VKARVIQGGYLFGILRVALAKSVILCKIGKFVLEARTTSLGISLAAAELRILLQFKKRNRRGIRDRPRLNDTLQQQMFGEWLSLVEHLVRDQGVGGSNPLSPTIISSLE
jgi:hypothetical protein